MLRGYDRILVWLIRTPWLPFRKRWWTKAVVLAARRDLVESVELVDSPGAES